MSPSRTSAMRVADVRREAGHAECAEVRRRRDLADIEGVAPPSPAAAWVRQPAWWRDGVADPQVVGPDATTSPTAPPSSGASSANGGT